jgi:hypothetical protein
VHKDSLNCTSNEYDDPYIMVCTNSQHNMEVHIMDKRIIRTVSTKVDADDVAVNTILTIDYANCTLEDLYEKAAKSDAILWQASARKLKEIPETATYISPRPGTRSMQPIDFKGALVKVFGEDKVRLLETKFGTAELAYKALKPQLDALMADVESEG